MFLYEHVYAQFLFTTHKSVWVQAEKHLTRTYLDLVKNMSASMLASLVFCQKQNINQLINQ